MKWILSAVILALSFPLSGQAMAQASRNFPAFKAAEAQLKPLSEDEQFALAGARCKAAMAARQPDENRIWCALAGERAFWRKPRGAAEIDIMYRAVWLSAIDGLHQQVNPWWGSPLAETVIIGNDLKRLSLLVLADRNRKDYDLMEFNFGRLTRLVGAERQRGESNGALRRRALVRLEVISALPQGAPAPSEVLWAKAAIGATLVLADRRDDLTVEGRFMAAALKGDTATALVRFPDELGLAPALAYSAGIARRAAGERGAADALMLHGQQTCEQQVWAGAALCDLLKGAQTAGPASDDPVLADLLVQTRAHVQANWKIEGPVDDSQTTGYLGDFTPSAGTRRAFRCDAAPLGAAAFTIFDGGVCAVTPQRKDGEVVARIALAFPGEAVVETTAPRLGGGPAINGGTVLFRAYASNQTREEQARADSAAGMIACAPKTTTAALACLDKFWSAETKKEFSDLGAKEVILAHHGVGTWMRNNWGLWAGGPLSQFYVAQEVKHPDSMSTVILNAYWLKLHGCRLEWDKVAAVRAAFAAAEAGQVCGQ